MILATLLAMGGAYATSITAQGWSIASVVTSLGETSYVSQHDTLPSFLGVEIVDTNATKVILSQTVARRKNQSGTEGDLLVAAVIAKYRLETSDPSPGSTVTIRGSMVGIASGSCQVEYSGGGAKSLAEVREVKAKVGPLDCNFHNSPLTPEDSTPPSKKFAGKKVVEWVSGGLGKVAYLHVPMPRLTSSAQAYWSGGWGNSIAATATATATAKFYPASFSNSTEALLAGTVNYPTGAMSIDIYTPLNVLVDLWTTNVENSTYEIPPDLATGTYRVYFSIPYQSLRKRIDVSYSSLIGASGVNPTLLFGDLDGDNYVSQSEVDFVYSKVGQATYPGKYIAGDSYAIGDCDFNCDGVITLADFNLAAPNVGLTGD